jgi:hypothetical protein
VKYNSTHKGRRFVLTDVCNDNHGGNCNLWYESDTWQFVVDKSIVDILNS